MYMQPISKSLINIIASVLVIGTVFGAGFYVGTSNAIIGNERASASEQIELGSFWKVWNALDEKFVPVSENAGSDDEKRVIGAIKGMVESLGDPYTVFFDPEELESFETDISGSFQGVGMEVGMRDGIITVIAPIKGAPAEKAGVRAGDYIVKIDETPASDLTVDEAVGLIRGDKGTTVTLTLSREGVAEPVVIKVVRDTIELPTLETELRKDGVFVIKLYSFNSPSANLFKKALREFVLSKSDKLVIDLRGNPGGYLDSAVEMSSWFLPSGKVIVREDFGEGKEEEVMRSKGYELFNGNLKLVILVDEGSASASEILAGALQDYGVATIVGETTFGKGSVQELVEIDEDTALKVTIARWLTPEGRSISDGGLTPDVIVELDADRLEKEKYDTQLEKAVEVLKGM
jgi:carboxyl-terminal processing protease